MYAAVMLAVLFAFDGVARAQSVGIVTGATLWPLLAFWMTAAGCITKLNFLFSMAPGGGDLIASGIKAQVFTVLLGGRTGDALDIA